MPSGVSNSQGAAALALREVRLLAAQLQPFLPKGATKGDLVVFNGTAWTRLSAGGDGDVLTSQGIDLEPLYAPVGPIRSILLWGANGILAGAGTRYLYPGYDDSNAMTTPVFLRAPFDGTARSMYVDQNNPGGNGNPITYTLDVNGGSTDLTVTMASTDAQASDTTHVATFAEGDTLVIRAVKPTSIGSSPNNIVASLEIRSS